MTDIQKLYDTTLQSLKINELTKAQSGKFIEACERVFIDNPNNSFNDNVIAAKIYLKYIISFPDLTLPPKENNLDK